MKLDPQIPLAWRRAVVPLAPAICVKRTTDKAKAEKEISVGLVLWTLLANALDTRLDTACVAEWSDFMT